MGRDDKAPGTAQSILIRILAALWLTLTFSIVASWLRPDPGKIVVKSATTCLFDGREVPCGGPLVERIAHGDQ
jgi:hypothetical protein